MFEETTPLPSASKKNPPNCLPTPTIVGFTYGAPVELRSRQARRLMSERDTKKIPSAILSHNPKKNPPLSQMAK
jgi:hypothetical protein